MHKKANILLCDDEQEIIDLLKLYFDSDDYNIYEANDGEKALEIFKTQDIDLAVIDVMMPKLSGLKLISKIRAQTDIPLMILSALDSLKDKLAGYRIGADDYITKPFEPLEVLAKVKSKLRNLESPKNSIVCGDLELNLHECSITVAGKKSELSKVEFAVLKLFMESPNRVFTKAQVYTAGWDEEYYQNENSIRVILSRIRAIIGSERIQTVRGLGYRFKP
jgi:DNA-binding response OmpR family regulator